MKQQNNNDGGKDECRRPRRTERRTNEWHQNNKSVTTAVKKGYGRE